MTDFKILIIENIEKGSAGLLFELEKEFSFVHETVSFFEGDRIADIDEYQALICLGGPQSVNDEVPAMQEKLHTIRRFLQAEKPFLGICLGIQALVKALGGEAVKSPVIEAGFRRPDGEYFQVELTPTGQNDPFFKNISPGFPVLEIHNETVIPGDEIEILATGNPIKVQAVKYGKNAYGTQFHFEFPAEKFFYWSEHSTTLRENVDQDEFLADAEKFSETYRATGLQFFRNFLNIAGCPQRR